MLSDSSAHEFPVDDTDDDEVHANSSRANKEARSSDDETQTLTIPITNHRYSGVYFSEIDANEDDVYDPTQLLPNTLSAPRLRKTAPKMPTETAQLLEKDAFDDFVELSYGTALPKNVNLEDTFWYMKHRQWSRLYLASYGPQSQSYFSFRFLFFYGLLYTTYLLLQILYFKRHNGYVLEFLLMGLISLVSALLSKFLRWFPRLILLEIYLFFFFFTIFHLYQNPSGYIPLATLIVGHVVITILLWVLYPYVLRALSRVRGGVAPKISVDDESTKPRYEIYQDAWCTAPYNCVYEGDMLNGRPHGLGSWFDTSSQGENLYGVWHNGIPIGPFESVESETRNILVSLRVIYGTIHGGGWSWLNRGPLSYGVASVETCVSGSFFKKFPICRLITEKKVCECRKAKCVCILNIFKNKYYRHINDSKPLKSITISVDRKNRRLHVPGHKPTVLKQRDIHLQLKKNAGNNFSIGVDERWLPMKSQEGLLFIHGIFHNLDDALKRFGHFLAMGHFPGYIKPFVWNWPSSSSPLLYTYAQKEAMHPDNHKEFKRFLMSIKNSGIENLSIMCHSMGTRFLLHSFPVIQSLFKRKVGQDIATDAEDGDLGHQSQRYYSHFEGDGMEISNLILLNPDYEVDSFKQYYQDLSPYCRTITVYADSRDRALSLAHRLNQQASLGANVKALYDQNGNLLDLDIIDTGELDSNVNSRRHGFFNVSRPMVDDLYDLIVNGNRAEDRTSRLKPYRAVYRFTVIPSTVMDI